MCSGVSTRVASTSAGSLGVFGVPRVKHALTGGQDLLGLAAVHARGRQMRAVV